MDPATQGRRPFLKHQVAPFDFIAPRNRVGILLDKRLGKCKLAIEWLYQRPFGLSLISAPMSAIPDWQTELQSDGLHSLVLSRHEAQRDPLAFLLIDRLFKDMCGKIVFLVNPQGLFLPSGRRLKCPDCQGQGFLNCMIVETREFNEPCPTCEGKTFITRDQPEPNEIAKLPWDTVIWDESVSFANPQSQTNQIAFECFGNVPNKAILSGEYCPEGPHQAFEQMRWLFGHFMGHKKFWSWRHENFIKVGHDWCPKLGTIAKIKASVASKCIILSRKSAGVGSIPPTMSKRWCDLPDKVRKIYRDVEQFFELPSGDPDQPPIETKYGVVARNWLTQIAGGFPKGYPHLVSTHKIQVLLELIRGEYAKEPLVVSFNFNSEINAVAEALQTHKIVFSILRGATPLSQRKNVQESFQSGQTRIILKQCRVKYGVNLSKADTMIRYSLPDSFNDLSQDADRIVSPLKDTALEYIDIVCRDTVDQDKVEALGDKRITARYFMQRVRENFCRRTGKKLDAWSPRNA